MTWRYKNPNQFPAIFTRRLQDAALAPDTWFTLEVVPSSSDAKIVTERWRYFTWCIRQRPAAVPDMARLLEQFDYRSSIKKSGFRLWDIRVRARPTIIKDLLALNPEHRDLISSA